MKTAVSLPDDVFEAAERVAKRRKISRSELYALALRRLVEQEDDAHVTEQLNRVYADDPGALDPVLRALPARVLEREEW